MSLSWSDLDKENMRDIQEALMMDEGYRWAYSRVIDSFGDENETWTQDTSSTPCGVEILSGTENRGNDMTVVSYEALIRLPHGFTIDPKDRFQVTKHRGTVVSWTYEITAPIQAGVSGFRIPVKRVEV